MWTKVQLITATPQALIGTVPLAANGLIEFRSGSIVS